MLQMTVKGFPMSVPGPGAVFDLELPKGIDVLSLRHNTRSGVLEIVGLIDLDAKATEVWQIVGLREDDLPSAMSLGRMTYIGHAMHPNGLVDHFFGQLSKAAKSGAKKKADR